MRALLTGAGNMGRAMHAALDTRGDEVAAMLGRGPRPSPRSIGPVDVAFEFSAAQALLDNVRFAAQAGARVMVIGTTGWAQEPGTAAELTRIVNDSDMRAVVGPTFSLGVVLFTALAEEAARHFGAFPEYDPYVLEWHRRSKVARPSGTALAIADRLLPNLPAKRRARLADGSGAPDPDTLEVVSLRAGASPGMHLVGFDAPGESIELRITARDRSAYVSGALLAADSLLAQTDRSAGIISFEGLVHETLAVTPATPTVDQATLAVA